jgi:hypothetical protein
MHFLSGAALARTASQQMDWLHENSSYYFSLRPRTDFAEVTVGGARNADFPRVDFWDTAGGYLGTCVSPLGGLVSSPGCTITLAGDGSTSSPDFAEPWFISLTSSTANIGFLTAGGWGGGQFVSGLTFNSVPEPGTLGLLALGALGLVLTQRRKMRAASRGEYAN